MGRLDLEARQGHDTQQANFHAGATLPPPEGQFNQTTPSGAHAPIQAIHTRFELWLSWLGIGVTLVASVMVAREPLGVLALTAKRQRKAVTLTAEKLDAYRGHRARRGKAVSP